jgi:FtsP/CotA-like multicopper oxidase with cupredoxin domain
MYRRQFLANSAALGAGLLTPSFFSTKATAATDPRPLTIATRTLDINGKAATVYGLTGSDGKPGLMLRPGEDFKVALKNRLTEDTIVHWHGLTPPWEQDGVVDNPLPMLKAGETRAYDFPVQMPGTYWMHAHTLQEQNLLAAPLIVHSQQDLAADMQEVVVLLHDFSFKPAEELLSGLTGGRTGMNHKSMNSMNMNSSEMGTMKIGSMDMSNMGGMDVNDITYDAYLANDRTLDDPEIVQVEKSGLVRLRIINGGASTAFTISTAALDAKLVAVDGKPVKPIVGTLFPISMGQRIDLAIAIPKEGGTFPILALREGAVEQTGIILATPGETITKIPGKAMTAGPVLDLSLEARLSPIAPLADRKADRAFMVHLAGNMASYQWGIINGDKLAAKSGERIEISMMNMSMMAHPMHLHGHEFQVISVGGSRISGAMRDTVLVPPMQTVTIAFDAGRPGKWPFHCHHLYHMVSGMMVHLPVI